MTDLNLRTLDGSTKKISPDTVTALRSGLRGTVAFPGEDGYDAARTIWNAMIDRQPPEIILGASTSSMRSSSRETRSCSLPCAAAATTSPGTPCATGVCSSTCR